MFWPVLFLSNCDEITYYILMAIWFWDYKNHSATQVNLCCVQKRVLSMKMCRLKSKPSFCRSYSIVQQLETCRSVVAAT